MKHALMTRTGIIDKVTLNVSYTVFFWSFWHNTTKWNEIVGTYIISTARFYRANSGSPGQQGIRLGVKQMLHLSGFLVLFNWSNQCKYSISQLNGVLHCVCYKQTQFGAFGCDQCIVENKDLNCRHGHFYVSSINPFSAILMVPTESKNLCSL